MKIILFLVISFSLLFSNNIEFKNGDIAFTYNSKDIIDISLKNFLKSKYSHTYIFYNDKFYSITIDYIGDKGKIDTLDPNEIYTYDNVIVFRPLKLRKYQQKCINNVVESNIDNVIEKRTKFDWLYKKNNRYLFCTEFATEPYRRCTNNYLMKSKKRFPMDKILNRDKFKIIYQKHNN